VVSVCRLLKDKGRDITADLTAPLIEDCEPLFW